MRAVPYIAVFVVLVFSTAALAAIPVEVTVGKGTIITLKKYTKRISLTDPSVADVILLSPSEMVINGKKVGTTSLITWDRAGERTFFDLNVRESRPGDLPQVLLQVKVAQIDRSRLVELGLSALAKGIDSGNAEGMAGLVATPGGTLGGDSAGVDVTPGIEGYDLDNLVPQIGVTHFPSGVSAFIKALAENGLSTILAEPNLVVKSGETGEFLAGSRIPVQQVTGTGADLTVSIVYEEVGVKLNFAPLVQENGTISLMIDPAEVSSISEYVTFAGIVAPQIDTRTVKTSVDLREGESLILAGLLSEEMKKNIQKFPILGDIPILGALFRSTRDELEQTELAFFITPKLVEPLPPGEEPELPGEQSVSPEEKRKFNWIPIPEFLYPDGEEETQEVTGAEEEPAPAGEMEAE
jgi:pilus assembly protein CpaC